MKKICLYIMFFLAIISLSSFTDNDRDIKTKTNNFVVSVNIEEQVINIKFNAESNIQNIKIINNNSEIIVESGSARGYGNSTIEIPITSMESGTYFIRIQTDSGIEIQRIIIN
jgi:hypothetical protein